MDAMLKLQKTIGLILLIGTLISTAIVMLGGTLYLLQNGNDALPSYFFHPVLQHLSIGEIWRNAVSFTPLGMVQLGLLLLISTQTIRVLLLCWFYFIERDYAFAIISLFILAMLVYSSCWRH